MSRRRPRRILRLASFPTTFDARLHRHRTVSHERLARLASSAEDSTRKLANTVRAEIKTLDHALEETIARIQEVEGMISRQAQAVQEMRGQAKANAGDMISGMEKEREELNKIARDLLLHVDGQGRGLGV